MTNNYDTNNINVNNGPISVSHNTSTRPDRKIMQLCCRLEPVPVVVVDEIQHRCSVKQIVKTLGLVTIGLPSYSLTPSILYCDGQREKNNKRSRRATVVNMVKVKALEALFG